MIQMEKLVNRCDMELMKMAMLKHEETFRQQVHELHRLYRVQKQLMSGLSRPSEPTSCRRQRRKQPRRSLDLRLPATPPSSEDGLELTLAVGGGRGSRRRRRDDVAPFASDCSGGGSLTTSSSSADTGGSPYQRVMEGTVAPWLVQCLSLKMA
ncbi:hypothetical protein ACP70R_045760 [Stipagrostis hirtigluma subsp. patula]